MDLTEPVEIAPGKFKPIGECTVDDLRASAKLARATAEMHGAAAAGLEAERDGDADGY